ncbi:ferredoxin family protein [Streptomyces sp. NPDC050997]|uniref:ferredoxin family protein n=1 Tax=Streptomyces sp. NPDC050997 TaxID=3155519 RepID=UPI00341591FE
MIEIVERDRCIGCDMCVDVCPTSVFDRGPDGVPVIARQDSGQTCFQCEAYCPTDALLVAPLVTAVASGSRCHDVRELEESGLLGGYGRQLGWGRRALGARTAVGAEYPG